MFRKFQLLLLGAILVIAAFSTGWSFLFYLVYLGVLVVGGSYVLTRLGLADLEAGYAVNQLSGHVGDRIRVTYTLRNTSRIPKPWLEIHNPTSLPAGLPGRAISLGGRTERSWLIRTPLTRRGHFRIEPLQIRTGDPFGFFEASATVGQGISVVVYPRLEPLPRWHLPAATINLVVQALIPPPKYFVDRLVPGVPQVPRARLADMVVIQRGGDGESTMAPDEALETLLANCADAYGFPPYAAIEGFLCNGNGRDLKLAERTIIARALGDVRTTLLESSTMDWWRALPAGQQSGVS